MLRSHALRELNRKYQTRGNHANSRNNLNAPAKWNRLPTIAIRIPQAFKEQLLEYARQLDSDTTEQPLFPLQERLQALLDMKVRDSSGVQALKASIKQLIDDLYV
jgi:hypothetical protein